MWVHEYPHRIVRLLYGVFLSLSETISPHLIIVLFFCAVVMPVSAVIGENADFGYTPESGPAPLNVQFIDKSTGDVISWEWNLGDGSPYSYDQNPCHTFPDQGSYEVCYHLDRGLPLCRKTVAVTALTEPGVFDAIKNPVPLYAYDCTPDGVLFVLALAAHRWSCCRGRRLLCMPENECREVRLW